MKYLSRTYALFIFLFFALSSCTRNPLGEQITQPILNLGFTLSHSCATNVNEFSPYTCSIQTSEVIPNLVWKFEPENTCTWAVIDTATGVVSGTATNANIAGCDLVVSARNDKRRSLPILIHLTVVNVAPTLTIGNAANILEDAPLTVIRTDADVQSSEEASGGFYTLDNLTATAPRCADNATALTINSTTGEISYQPALNYFGTCQIKVIYDDGGGWPNSTVAAEFSITVDPVNDAPVLAPIAAQTMFESGTLNLPFTITDVDNTLNCSAVTYTSSNTTLVPNGSGISFSGTAPNCIATITPVAFLNGNTDLTFTISDGALSATQTFNLVVVPVNDPPTLSPIANQTTNEDTPITVNFNVTDPDNILTCSAVNLAATSSNGTLLPVANIVYGGVVPNCTATLTPVADLSGATTITLTVNDNGVPNLQDTQTFNLTVIAVNDAPVLSALTSQTINEDSSVTINYTITDVDSTLNCSTSTSATSSNGALLPVASIVYGGTAPNCTATLTPLADQNGVTNLVFTLTDGALTASQNMTLTVTAVNDAPVISAVPAQSTNEDIPVAVNFTISDVDNTLDCSTSMSATSSNTILLPNANMVFTGTAPNCTVTLSPVLDLTGTSNIVLTVTDGLLTQTSNFVLTVVGINDPPVIAPIANQTTSEDTTIAMNFNMTDPDSTLDCATSVSVTSTNGALVSSGDVTFSGTAPNCTAQITPALNQNGSVDLTFTVDDMGSPALQDSATFSLTVNPVNDAPVISAISNQTTSEDATHAVNFTITDIDSPLNCSTSMSFVSSNTTLVASGDVTFGGAAPNCTATVVPQPDQNGSTNLTLTVSDGFLSAVQAFTLTVNPVNDFPVMAAVGPQATNEDTGLPVSFTITDIDSTLSCSSSMSFVSSNIALVSSGDITFSGTAPNCTATVNPKADQNGTSNITFTVTDGILSASQTFTLTVNPVNDAPVLAAIANQFTGEGNPITVNLNVTDVDNIINCGTAFSATTSDGTLVPIGNITFGGIAPACTVTLTPMPLMNGTVTIGLTVTDGALTATQNFDLTIAPVNDPPVLGTITNQLASEDNSVAVNFTVTDPDSIISCSNVNLSATSSNAAVLPVANIVFGGVIPNCTATLTPVADSSGVSNVTITVNDLGAPNLIDTQSFTFTVTPVNDAPVLSAISNQTTSEDNSVAVNFTINDVDNTLNCGTSVSYTSSNTALIDTGDIVFSGAAPNCTATINPKADQNGLTNLTFTLTDGTLTSVQNFSLTVTSVNDAPVLSAISNQTTSEDNSVAVNFTINDVDNTLNCAISVSYASSNTALIDTGDIAFSGTAPNCTATINPKLDQSGLTNLTFTLTDGTLTSVQNFTLTVTPVNDAPVLSTISNQTTSEDNSVAVNFTINDVDNALNCATSVSYASSNTALIDTGDIAFSGTAPNCTATINPKADQNGLTNLTFTLTDGTSTSVQNFSLTVTPVNDAPILSAIINQNTTEGTPLAVNFTITDVDNTLNCGTSVSATSTNTTLLPLGGIVFSGSAPNCTVTLTPTAFENGTTDVTLTLTDGTVTAVRSFTLTVAPQNDPPVMSAIVAQTVAEDSSVVVNFTITDPDSTLACDALHLTATTSNGTILPLSGVTFGGTAPNCTATLAPALNQNGVVNITLTVSDLESVPLTAAQSFALTVTAVNDAPILSAISNQTTFEDNSVAVNFTINDVDNTLNCATSVSYASSNTTLIDTGDIVFSGAAPNCTATINPKADQNGLTNLTFTLTDGSLTSVQNFSLTVNSVNDAPVLSAISNQTTSEDNSVAVNFTITDVDNTLNCGTSVSYASSNTTLIDTGDIVFSGAAPNCTATINPKLDQSGLTNLTFTLTDGTLTSVQNFSLTVNSVNDAPVLSAISNQTTSEDNSVAVNFTITDVDNTLNCGTSVSYASSNTALIDTGDIVFSGAAPNCTATLNSKLNQNGLTNLTFTLTDGSLTSVQNFSLTVTPVNDAPVLSAISNQTTAEDTPLIVNLTANDVDSLILCTSVNVTVTSSNGALIPDANIVVGGTAPNCNLTLTPLADQFGVSNITVVLNDNAAPNLQSTQNFSFTVTAVNDAPVLSAISNQTTSEDNSVAVNFTINDVDNTLNCGTSVSYASSNTALIDAGDIVFTGVAPNCTATMNPKLNQNGLTNLTFTLTDGTLTSVQNFSLTVTAVNDAPILSAISNQATSEDSSVAVNITITDVDNTLNCGTSISAASTNITLMPISGITFGGTAPNCTVTLAPALNQNGTSDITLTLTDGTLTSVQTFTLTVVAINDAPVISAISSQAISEDNSVVVNFTINDVDSVLNCSTSMSASSSNTALLPVSGIAFGGTAPNCTATLTPLADQNGLSNIVFTVTDGVTPVTSAFSLTVAAVNDSPVLSAISSQTTSEDVSLAVNFTVSDIDNTLNCATSMTASSSNTAIVPVSGIVFSGTAPNCTATVTPALNQNGAVNLTFRLSDGALFHDQTFALTVNPVNDAPVISSIANQSINEDTSVVVNFTITDVDSTLSCAAAMSSASSATALIASGNITFGGTAPNCTATLVPIVNQSGTSDITFTVTDGSLTASTTFQLEVVAIDDPPTIAAITAKSMSEDGTLTFGFTVNDTDTPLLCDATNLLASSSNSTLMPAATIVFGGTAPNCTATFTPQPNQFGTSTITFVVTDGTSLASRNFTLTVTAVNDAPVLTSFTNQTLKTDASVAQSYTLTDIDNTMNCSTSITATSSNTAIIANSDLVKSGTAPNCTLTVNPSLNVAGTVTVTVTASDGSATATQTFTVTTVNVTSLAVNPTTTTLINAGSTQQIVATATYSDSSTAVVTTNTGASWTSSATGVATVNNAGSKGLVTAVANGNANITATYKGVSAVTAASVVTMTGITVSQSVINSGIGTVVNVSAQAIYNPSGTQDITSIATWSSSNSGVASVSAGAITLNSAGTATITASYGGFSQTVSVTVQNISLVSIDVTPASHSMGVNATRNFIATATYSDASTANVTNSAVWSSTNTAVATISNTAPTIGRATALAGGSSTITATIGAVSGTAALTVTAATLTSIAITPDDSLVTSNGNYQLRAIGTFSDASTSDITEQVTWSSSNTTAATISNTAGTKGRATTPTFTGYRTTTIAATLGAVSDTTPFGVNGSTVTSIIVTPTVQITPGSTYNLVAMANLADGGSIDVTDFAVWSSGTTSVATVSNGTGTKGLVTGVANGTATISAVYGGQTGTRVVTVAGSQVITEVGTGLLGQYYNWTGGAPPTTANAFLSANKKGERIDARINFAWGSGNAPMGVGDYFSVRWTGFYKATSTTNYFCTYSDDGIRVYINGALVIDNWTLHGPTWNCTANIPMTVGTKYSITYEFFENGGGAVAHLTRSSVSAADAQNTGTRAVQQVDLYPN